jgi:hypothetical protein
MGKRQRVKQKKGKNNAKTYVHETGSTDVSSLELTPDSSQEELLYSSSIRPSQAFVTYAYWERDKKYSEKGSKRQSNKFVVYSQILGVLLRIASPFTRPTTSYKQTLPGRGVCCAAVRVASMTYLTILFVIISLAILATLCPSLFIWYAHSPQCHDVIPWGGKRWKYLLKNCTMGDKL